VRGKTQVSLQAAAGQPLALQQSSAGGARGFNPAQHQSALATVISRENQEPQDVNNGGAQRGYDDETHHKPLRCEWYDLRCCTRKIFIQLFQNFAELL
jgi:hypothetical protein